MSERSGAEFGDPVPGESSAAVDPVGLSTPGSALRMAREARGLSIVDVVQVIRFSVRQIEALERDDYASLPGSTAVRGLVRSYAKLLKLDAEPLLAQLDPAVPVPEADVRPPTNMGEAEQPTLVEQVPPRFIASGVAVFLLAVAAYWYASQSDDGGFTRLMRSMTSSSSGGSPAPAAVLAPLVVPVVAPAPAVVAESEPVNAGVISTPIPFAGLRVEFDEHSWIEIRDATQKVVFVGEYPAGTRQNVEGKAPFQIWIGRASGVRLFMGERSIDLKPHTREEVARFSLE